MSNKSTFNNTNEKNSAMQVDNFDALHLHSSDNVNNSGTKIPFYDWKDDNKEEFNRSYSEFTKLEGGSSENIDINNVSVSLFTFYQLIMTCGGFDEVDLKQKWSLVCAALGVQFDGPEDSVYKNIKAIYLKRLYKYEMLMSDREEPRESGRKRFKRIVKSYGGYDLRFIDEMKKDLMISSTFIYTPDDFGTVKASDLLLSLRSKLPIETTRAINILAVIANDPEKHHLPRELYHPIIKELIELFGQALEHLEERTSIETYLDFIETDTTEERNIHHQRCIAISVIFRGFSFSLRELLGSVPLYGPYVGFLLNYMDVSNHTKLYGKDLLVNCWTAYSNVALAVPYKQESWMQLLVNSAKKLITGIDQNIEVFSGKSTRDVLNSFQLLFLVLESLFKTSIVSQNQHLASACYVSLLHPLLALSEKLVHLLGFDNANKTIEDTNGIAYFDFALLELALTLIQQLVLIIPDSRLTQLNYPRLIKFVVLLINLNWGVVYIREAKNVTKMHRITERLLRILSVLHGNEPGKEAINPLIHKELIRYEEDYIRWIDIVPPWDQLLTLLVKSLVN